MIHHKHPAAQSLWSGSVGFPELVSVGYIGGVLRQLFGSSGVSASVWFSSMLATQLA